MAPCFDSDLIGIGVIATAEKIRESGATRSKRTERRSISCLFNIDCFHLGYLFSSSVIEYFTLNYIVGILASRCTVFSLRQYIRISLF